MKKILFILFLLAILPTSALYIEIDGLSGDSVIEYTVPYYDLGDQHILKTGIINNTYELTSINNKTAGVYYEDTLQKADLVMLHSLNLAPVNNNLSHTIIFSHDNFAKTTWWAPGDKMDYRTLLLGSFSDNAIGASVTLRGYFDGELIETESWTVTDSSSEAFDLDIFTPLDDTENIPDYYDLRGELDITFTDASQSITIYNAMVAVPEPSTFLLFGICMAAALFGYKKM